MSGRKNLIMGLWSDLPFDGLERFIASLRRTTFDGDVCVFVDNVPAATVKALLAHGIIVERAARFALPQMNYQGSRYHSYQEFLGRFGSDYDKVMITDLRDVIFQSDPFATPFPADIVFAQERRRIGDCPTNRSWIVQTYGEAMADNLRHCMVSCSGTTFGTVGGMHLYLSVMINELTSRPMPISGGLDQAIHNFLIRMRPLRNAWCDPADSMVATLSYVPDEAIRIEPDGVLVDGKLVPVVHQWDRKSALREHIESAPHFRLESQSEPRYPIALRRPATGFQNQSRAEFDAVICCYHRERDAPWLEPFLATLRAVGFAGDIHCVGKMDATERSVVSNFGGIVHPVVMDVGDIDIDNAAHLHISRLLDELAGSTTRPDQVLAIDTLRAGFLRDPFIGKTIGLSVFCEGPVSLAESDYNLQRVALFTDVDGTLRQRPIVSSAVLRGSIDVLRNFYHKLLAEMARRRDLLTISKVVQGAFNKLCHSDDVEFPVIVHPNASEVYFEIWPQSLTVDIRLGLRVGGAMPFMVVNPFRATPLMDMLRASLQLGRS